MYSSKIVGDIHTPKVCVLMPVYNGGNTIRYAISSLLKQTYTNWICIVVNDGSTDETKIILDELTDPRFRVYHLNHNSGRGVARDEALRHAEGDYLAYLDADDMLHEDKLRLQVEYLLEHPNVSLVSCGAITFTENFVPMRPSGTNLLEPQDLYKYGQPLPITLASSMILLSKARNICYNHNLSVGEDYDYFSRYCDGSLYANLPYAYYYYLTGNLTAKKLLNYQVNSMKLSLTFINNGLYVLGFKDLATRMVKLIIYVIMLPFIGTKGILGVRYGGEVISSDLKAEFESQVHSILEK